MADSRLEFLAPTGFEWDEDKSNANLIKHGIDFEDASEVFYGPVIVRASNRNSEERDGSRSENPVIESWR